MAFGFFKKQEKAELVLHNAHIYTMDPDYPWAEAVAVKDGKILSVGELEQMDQIVGNDTKLVDLEGKYVYPGFIDIHRSPVMNVFEGKYLDLSAIDTEEELIDALRGWAEENPDSEVVFGYGYKDSLKPKREAAESENAEEEAEAAEDAEEAAELEIAEEAAETEESDELEIIESPFAAVLNRAVSDRPVLLLGENNFDIWTNTAADRIIIQTAQDEVVDTITTGYVLNLLLPFDFEEVEADVKNESEKLAEAGVTSVLNLQAPEYFEDLYMDSLMGMYNEDKLKQRFFSSFYANRPLIPRGLVYKLMQRKTNAIELGDLIHADMFNLVIDNEKCGNLFDENKLAMISEAVADKGFGFFIEAKSKEDLLLAYTAAEHVRSKGYKNMIVIASDEELTEDEATEMMHIETFERTWRTDIGNAAVIYGRDFSDAEKALEQLTIVPARIAGMENELGTIEKGKLADMCVYNENFFELNGKPISRLQAEMTILGGKIVYDLNNENNDEMMDIMFNGLY